MPAIVIPDGMHAREFAEIIKTMQAIVEVAEMSAGLE